MSRFDTLVRVSRLYYELDETQGRIAEIVGLTRPQVSRLLKQARAEGIVEIRIVDRTSQGSSAEEALVGRFRLRAAHLAPTVVGPEELTRRSVGRLAAQVFVAEVRDGMIVGVGDGSAVSATTDALDAVATPIGATIVPLCGGFWFGGAAREPYRRVADALGATAHPLLAPGLLEDAATRDGLYGHLGVRGVRDLWDRLDVALFGIGGPSWTEAQVGAPIMRELADAGAVGEVLIAPLDIDGHFVAEDLRSRVIAFDARSLGRVPVSIAVASGPAKVAPILAALRAGVVTTLVTDVRTAEAIVRLDETTGSGARGQGGSGAPR